MSIYATSMIERLPAAGGSLRLTRRATCHVRGCELTEEEGQVQGEADLLICST